MNGPYDAGQRKTARTISERIRDLEARLSALEHAQDMTDHSSDCDGHCGMDGFSSKATEYCEVQQARILAAQPDALAATSTTAPETRADESGAATGGTQEVEPNHPVQPLIEDEYGVVRFKGNKIVRFLLDAGPFDMNQLAVMDYTDDDREQFAQLIGYSLSGFGELSYVSDETFNRADEQSVFSTEKKEVEPEARSEPMTANTNKVTLNPDKGQNSDTYSEHDADSDTSMSLVELVNEALEAAFEKRESEAPAAIKAVADWMQGRFAAQPWTDPLWNDLREELERNP